MVTSTQITVGATPVALATGATRRGVSQVSINNASAGLYLGDSTVTPADGFSFSGTAPLQVLLGDGDTIYAVSSAPPTYVSVLILS